MSRDRQLFYCFGCGKGGNLLTFLRDHEGLSFGEGIRKLADRVGIRLPAPTGRDDREEHERGQLLELNRVAARFFREQLEDPLRGGVARQYLKTRSLRPETVRRFGLGYAPDRWESLYEMLTRAGFKDSVIEASGLVRRGEGGTPYAFFRNRLMVPIRNQSGAVVAFGGRDLSGAQNVAKYINTPENVIYRKGHIVFALSDARETMRQEKRVILVEGYFDVMRCFEAGIQNVVATCGTALTAAQSTVLRRHVPEVVVVFDGDAAGIRAALRGVAVLNAAGLTVRALLLPDGKDPDDYIREHGREAFTSLVEAASDFVTFYVGMNRSRLTTIEGRTDVARELFTMLLGVDDELRRDQYLKGIAKELQLGEWVVRREFGRLERGSRSGDRVAASSEIGPSEKVSKDEVDFVAALLTHEPLLAQVKEALKSVPMGPGPLTEILEGLFAGGGADLSSRVESEEAGNLLAAAANSGTIPVERAEAVVGGLVKMLKREALTAESERVQQSIREAERLKDSGVLRELMGKRVSLLKEIEKLGAPMSPWGGAWGLSRKGVE